jgi:hypothetical protein
LVGVHRRVPDPVDRAQEVADADGVQAAPFRGGVHPGEELEVQVPVRVVRAAGEVPHRGRLQHLHRHLHLTPGRPDPGGGVLGQPGDDLLGGSVLSRLVRRGDVRVQRRSE